LTLRKRWKLQAKINEVKISHTRSALLKKQANMNFSLIGRQDIFILGMVTVEIYQKLVMLNYEDQKN